MKRFRLLVIQFLILLTINGCKSDLPKLKVVTADWEKLDKKVTRKGIRYNIWKGQTNIFSNFDLYAITLSPGKSKKVASDSHPDTEDLLIVKEGTLSLDIEGNTDVLEPGSVALIRPGDHYSVKNPDGSPVTFYIHKWKVLNKPEKSRQSGSIIYHWDKILFISNAKGGRRQVFQHHTSLISDLEMHVTTLNEGIQSHAPHTHADEEIILLVKGEALMMVDGKPFPMTPGSLLFVDGEIPHGIENTGKGQCEYFAYRFKP